jgi:hypothetical protein
VADKAATGATSADDAHPQGGPPGRARAKRAACAPSRRRRHCSRSQPHGPPHKREAPRTRQHPTRRLPTGQCRFDREPPSATARRTRGTRMRPAGCSTQRTVKCADRERVPYGSTAQEDDARDLAPPIAAVEVAIAIRGSSRPCCPSTSPHEGGLTVPRRLAGLHDESPPADGAGLRHASAHAIDTSRRRVTAFHGCRSATSCDRAPAPTRSSSISEKRGSSRHRAPRLLPLPRSGSEHRACSDSRRSSEAGRAAGPEMGGSPRLFSNATRLPSSG